MTLKEALAILRNRVSALALNHKIGSRDIAKQEVKDIVMSIETYVIPTFDQALTELEALKRYPTSEEVCEAIQRELEYGTVEYFEGNREFMFVNHGEKANITDCYGDRYKVTGAYKSSTLILIGRFYEGLEK